MSALSIHKDNSLKLVLAPEVETSVKSVGLAVPQISVRPVELSRPQLLHWPTVSQSFRLSHNPPSTPPGTAVMSGQLEISAPRSKNSRPAMLRSGKWSSVEYFAPQVILCHLGACTFAKTWSLSMIFLLAKEPFTRSHSQLQFCSRLLSGYWSMVTLLWSLIMTWHYKTAKC